jgi:hypothetical protein
MGADVGAVQSDAGVGHDSAATDVIAGSARAGTPVTA